jgi:large subunit ribosomal protein L25
MREVSLAADTRRHTGSSESRRLRAAGKVPAVLYGHGMDPQSLVVDARELRIALSQEAGVNALVSLDVNGSRHLAMARQLQRHPVRGSVDHVDFVIVRRDEVVSAEVPIHLVGEASEVTRYDGLIEQQLFTLVVQATPADIPPHFEVDISTMAVGDTFRVGDLRLPTGVTTEVDAEEPIVLATASTLAAEIAAEDAAAAEEAATVEQAISGQPAEEGGAAAGGPGPGSAGNTGAAGTPGG